MCAIEKNRFFAEEAGRLLTAFLERFFERYVGYDFTAGMEEELDDVSGGRAGWKECSTRSGATSSPRPTRSWSASRPRSPRRSTSSWPTTCSRQARRRRDPRLCPNACGRRGRLSLRGGRFGAFIACSNYPECKFTPQVRPAGGAASGDDGEGPTELGDGIIARRTGRFGPYVAARRGQGGQARLDPQGHPPSFDLEWAVKLLSLPRDVGPHPESGKPITASIGRYGPYLRTTASTRSCARPPRCSRPA